MIPRAYKNIVRTVESGVTLIETLVVVTVLAGLIASVGVSYIITLRSYVGEYKSEALELEASRAALELEYYVAHAKKVDIYNGGAISSSGNSVNLLQLDNTTYTFTYAPTGAVAGGSSSGSLTISGPDVYYVYSTNIISVVTPSFPHVFWVSPEGAISYHWAIDTPSGRASMAGSTLPGF